MKISVITSLAAFAAVGTLLVGTAANAQDAYHHSHGINQRLHNQHSRIEQGLRHGDLTRHEAHNLRRTDARIHRQEHRDRMVNGGNLTNRERRHLNGELNRDSGRIRRDKHDGM